MGMQIDPSMINDDGRLEMIAIGDIAGASLELTLKLLNTGELVTVESRAEVPEPDQYMIQLERASRIELIRELEAMNLLLSTDSAIRYKLQEILGYDNGQNVNLITMNLVYNDLEAQSMLYRIRKIWNEPADNAEKVTDLSYVPDDKRDKIKFGRVNNRKEQVMYLGDSVNTAMKESRLEKGDSFYLSIFMNKEKMRLLKIGCDTDVDSPYSDVHKVVTSFLLRQFTKTVEYGHEYEYRLSNIIAKHFYNYSANSMDGWIYPSVAMNCALNIALDRYVTDDKIELLVSFKGEMISENDYTLENPRIKHIENDELVELKSIVNTKEIQRYDIEKILKIQTFWNSFKKV